MNKKKTVLILICSLLFVQPLLLSGCSDGTNESEETKDIIYTSEAYGFELTFPASWEGRFEVEDNKGVGIQLICTAARDDNWPGILCFINRHPAEEFSNDIVPTIELGRRQEPDNNGEMSEVVYALFYASDVNYDPENQDIVDEYYTLNDDLGKVADSFKLIPLE